MRNMPKKSSDHKPAPKRNDKPQRTKAEEDQIIAANAATIAANTATIVTIITSC